MIVLKKQFWNACLGNLFEHYETALFGFLSPFLAPLFFPEYDALSALILTYAMLPLGMLARPFGSILFGYIGDAYGREYALFLTLAGMAFVSAAIAFTPTYLQVGILAPLLFCLGRALQNFFAAGETMGGCVFLLENTPKKYSDLLSGLYGASSIGGHLLASYGVFLLSQSQSIEQGWRVLYLLGCITAFFGCMIRRSSPPSSSPQVPFSENLSQLKNMFWSYRKPLFYIVINAGFAHATYSIALVLMNGFVPLVSSLTKGEMMKINTYLLLLDFCTLPFFGWVASKISREKLMLVSSLAAFLCAIPLMLSLQGASLLGIVLIRIAFVILGVAFFAPFHAWAQQLVPSHCRYALISFGYALGSQLLGSPTAAIALWCFQKTGQVSSVAWYWMGLSLVATLSLANLLVKEKSEQLITNRS